jgi:hypothetical protein
MPDAHCPMPIARCPLPHSLKKYLPARHSSALIAIALRYRVLPSPVACDNKITHSTH